MYATANFLTATSFFGLSLLINNGFIALAGFGFVIAGFVSIGFDVAEMCSRRR